MDLGAYCQIEKLGEIAKQNNIVVPRLRGYRLMKDEDPIDLKGIDKKAIAVSCVEYLCESDPFWSPDPSSGWTLSSWTDYLKSYYLVADNKEKMTYTTYSDVRWDRIHGWKRKVLKTCIHNEIKSRQKQWSVFNKYVGREDILYIHARIGGGNWPHYYKEVFYQPWFLEKVDDCFDSTYCDIYAKIERNEVNGK